MNPIIQKLQERIVSNPPCYGDNDAHAILEMLYCYYLECNSTDNDTVKVAFEELYCKMHGIPLRERDRFVDTVCSLCWEHKKVGFVEGVKVGVRLGQGITDQ